MMMNDYTGGEVHIDAEIDIVGVRKAVREAATQIGFGVTDVTRIVTSASELARNVFLYAGSGEMQWCLLNGGGKTGIELVFEDSGPGIADIEQVMESGYTTSRGMGMGLPGSRRLMGEMEIESELGKGTRVTVRKWLGR
jgi:serine/threonine-protein kinase RsbT